MLLVTRNTVTRSRWHGALTAVGVLTGNLVHIAYCTLGIALLLVRTPAVYNVLRVASAVYLMYLGVQGLRGDRIAVTGADTSIRQQSNAYWQGFFNNVLNPKGSLFYLGVFTQLITPDMPWVETMVLVIVMVSISALFWIVFVQVLHLPVVRVRLQASNAIVSRVFSVVLIVFGARLAIIW